MMQYKVLFELYEQLLLLIYAGQFINYSTFILSFVSGMCGKKRKNYKNLNILRTKIVFLDKMKASFIVSEGLSFCEIIKNRRRKH